MASARPLIGISSYGRAGKRKSFSLPCEYVDVVQRAGGVPVVLPPIEGENPEALAAMGGVILSGGGDIDPAHYGGPHHDANYGISPERDAFELRLARAVAGRPELPMLCICRGMQVLNVALGGDLIAHIPDHYGDDVLHRHPARRPVEHPVQIVAGSRLASIFQTTELTVRSWHHQAVRRLGAGLRAIAWSPDGVVEALEHDGHPFAIAVQWHPEVGALADPRQMRLFEALVAAAAAHAVGIRGSRSASGSRRSTPAAKGSRPFPHRRGTGAER